jgi:phosphotransacetylase
MPFIVQAPAKGSATTPFHAEKKTRADAIRAAVALVAKGVADVTITDEDGKTSSPANFRAFFYKRQRKSS